MAVIGSLMAAMLLGEWLILYIQGRRFALRDRLQAADVIIALAGTRGNMKNLEGKVSTAVRLYREGWAPTILFSGRFSAKVTDSPNIIPAEEVQAAVAAGRIDAATAAQATKTWDIDLGAGYMRTQALHRGVPEDAIITEEESLHTLENARFTAAILAERGARRIILITSPFHQLRTALTFAKVYREHGLDIDVMNYYAETGEWHPLTWFFSADHRRLVHSEMERIARYREKGDL
jgi:uncharacterized SAM-binding protein YcdF (DUF218 family)